MQSVFESSASMEAIYNCIYTINSNKKKINFLPLFECLHTSLLTKYNLSKNPKRSKHQFNRAWEPTILPWSKNSLFTHCLAEQEQEKDP